MTDFNIKVSAETQEAKKRLEEVDKAANSATKPRQLAVNFPGYADLSKNLNAVAQDTKNAANAVKEFYRIGSSIPFTPLSDLKQLTEQAKGAGTSTVELGKKFGTAGKVISTSMGTARGAIDGAVVSLAKVGFALAGIQASISILRQGFGGLFKETIGREADLRATILKTQTTLASTNRVFRNGSEITDPYEKIVTLTGAVAKNITSIRERSIALAGVTSNEVIEVFGIVAAQIGKIGGGLKEAEDLAINFSAALGTFGIPLYQARQEIGSILRGNITVDSYLAKALGITNEDVAKAKTQAGGVVAFLEDRLAASVAGQRIAAQGLSGVLSNLKDISELVSQSFGSGLLDPLLNGLSTAFEALQAIRKSLMAVAATAGSTLGGVLSLNLGRVSEGSALTPKDASGANAALEAVNSALQSAGAGLNSVFDTIYKQITSIIDRLGPALLLVVDGVKSLAQGLISLQIEKFKALVGVFTALVPIIQGASAALSAFLSTWGALLEVPLVQQFTQITAGMKLLNMAGITPMIRGGLVLQFILSQWGKIIGFVRTQFMNLRTTITTVIVSVGRFVATLTEAATRALTAWTPAAEGLKALRTEIIAVTAQINTMGQTLQRAGGQVEGLGNAATGTKSKLLTMAFEFVKINLIVLAVSAALSLITERFGAMEEAKTKIASDKRAQQALDDLRGKYANLGDAAAESEKRAAAFAKSLVDAEYDKAVSGLEKIRKKLQELQDLQKNKGVSGFFGRLGQALNPANVDLALKYQTTKSSRGNQTFEQFVLEENLKKEREAKQDLKKWEAAIDTENLNNQIKLEAEQRTGLEKELAEFRRQTDGEIFQQRQSLATKEIELFRAAGDLQITQLEIGLARLREGQQGRAAEAIADLDAYIIRKAKGENEIEAQQRALTIELGRLERAIIDYRYGKEKQIAEIRKKIGQYETEVADYRAAKAKEEGDPSPTPGGGGGDFAAKYFRRLIELESDGKWGGVSNSGARGYAQLTPGTETWLKSIGKGQLAANLLSKDMKVAADAAREYALYMRPKARDLIAKGDTAGLDKMLNGLWTSLPGGDEAAKPERLKRANKFLASASSSSSSSSSAAGGIPAGMNKAQLIKFMEGLGYKRTDTRSTKHKTSNHYENALDMALSNTPAGRAQMKRDALRLTAAGYKNLSANTDPSGQHDDHTHFFTPGGKVAGGAKGSKGGAAGSATAPVAPDFSQDNASIAEFDKIQRSIMTIEQRLQGLRAALQTAQTEEAFRTILSKLFPPVDFKTTENAIVGLEMSLKGLAAVTPEAYNSQDAALAVEYATELKILEGERKAYLEAIDKKVNSKVAAERISLELANKLKAKELEDGKKYLADLAKANGLKKKALDLSIQEANIQRLIQDSAAIALNTQNELFNLREAFLTSQAQAAGTDNPLLARRRQAESDIRAEQQKLTANGRTPSEGELARFEGLAEAARSSAEALGQLELSIFNYNKQLAFAKDVASSFSGGMKTLFSSVIRGGDLNEALSGFLGGLSEKLLTMATDYAFKPVEMQMEEVFKKLFGVQDPLIQSQTAQVTATQANTAAVAALTTALTTPALAAPGTGPVALDVIPFGGGGGATGAANNISPFGRAGSGITSAFGGLTESVTAAATSMKATATAAAATPQAFSGLQSAMGQAVGALSGIGMIAGGISQMGQKGGFLKGLASVFTGIGTTGLSLFKAKGGPVFGNRPYFVGDNPDGTLNATSELFVPSSSGTILSAEDTLAATREALMGAAGASSAEEDTDPATAALRAASAANGAGRGSVNNSSRINNSSSTSNSSSSSSSNAFNATRQSISALSGGATNPFAANSSVLTSTESILRERQIQREMKASMATGFAPIKVEFDSIDPSNFVTAGQLVESNKRSVAEAEAKLINKFKNSIQFRRSTGVA